MAEIYPNLLRR